MSEEAPTAREKGIADTDPVPGDARPSLGAFPDRYAAGDELGRGGMGRVVEAHDKLLGRTVALKEALDTDEEALRRFARETQITARLEHPSIVPVYDAGVSPEGSPFYVMRKVTGRPLDKLVAASTKLEERLALLPHVLAACQAVAHAHERGIIHRDLKPSNILVGARGETTVIDWGLAKARSEPDDERPQAQPTSGDSLHTRAGTVFGTPGFMSPEQLASSDVDERADVYALGATLFYMLAKQAPHTGETADDTEAAARRGPPPPIASVVDGVPRELSAIVDKALAYDLSIRYANAGALAEDLARFTTGQLVAAHDYSTRERIARFVRRHRALVITVAVAMTVLAIGAWVAVCRVLAARDEAIAQARAADLARTRETERAEDLVVSQARLLLATNPTGAVAMVRPLAATNRWRDVRAVAAGARASGVAYRLPGPSSVTFADMSHDGTRALVCGADGSIHVYDLAARTHVVIATLKGRVRAAFADEQRVLAWVGSTVTVIDIATKTTKTLEHAAPILRLEAQHGIAYLVDERRRPWRLDVETGALAEIPAPGQVTHLAISPDGKHVALAGEHLWMIETKHPELVEKVHDGKKFDLAWAPNSEHLAVIGPHSTYDITIHPEIEIGEYKITNQTLALARGTLYTAGMSGLTVGERGFGESDLASSMVGLYATKGELVVGGGRGVLRVFDGEHEYQIPLPATPISTLRASPRSPYILAVCAESILIWNVEHVMPRRIELPAYSQIVTVGRDHAWTITSGGTSRSVDVHTGEVRELGKLPPLRHSSPASGAFVVARPLASADTWIVRADGAIEPLGIDAAFATVLDHQRAVIATKARELIIYDVDKRTRQHVATYDAAIDRLLARESTPRWVVTALDDGTLSRHDLASGHAMQTRIARRTEAFSPGIATTAAMREGDVFFASGARLRRWKASGSIEDHVTCPRPIHSVFLLDETRLLVVAEDGTGYVARTDRSELLPLPTLGANYVWATLDPTLIVTDDRSGGVTVLDVVANAAWKIARATPAGSTPDITGDGSVVVMRDATLDGTAIALWPLDLPTTPEATAKWIDDMTNATFDPRTGMLGWPP